MESNNKFLNLIDAQEKLLIKVKEYLNEYEQDITPLDIIKVNRIQYNKYDKYVKIWFRDHRTHLEFDIKLNTERTKILMLFINQPELFENSKKYNL